MGGEREGGRMEPLQGGTRARTGGGTEREEKRGGIWAEMNSALRGMGVPGRGYGWCNLGRGRGP